MAQMRTTDRSSGIMAACEAYGKEIVAAMEVAPAGRSLETVEFVVRQRALALGRAMLVTALEGVEAALAEAGAPGCPRCGKRLRMIGRRERTVVTVLGPITVHRRCYRCPPCGESRIPFDERVGIERGGCSAGARLLISRTASERSFAKTAEELEALAGWSVSRETVRQVTEGLAQEVVAAQEQAGHLVGEEAPMTFPEGPAGPGPVGPEERVYISGDGTTVNTLSGWREVKAGMFYDQEQTQVHYVATMEPAETFGWMMRRHADAVGIGRAREQRALGDGAPWLWNLMRQHFPGSNEGVDYYHASEQVWACGRVLYGEGTPETERWARARLAEVWEGGAERLLKGLWGTAGRLRGETRQKRLRQLIGYVTTHRERLRYPEWRAAGIDVGSGPMESACKNVIGKRMKGSGMRWRVDQAEAMARLRAITAGTGGWAGFWRAYRHSP
jgi:hypothetical protein